MLWLAAVAVMAIPASGLPPPEPSHPGFLDAPHLQALCAVDGPGAEAARAICLGYITGAADTLLVPGEPDRQPTICPPGDLTPQLALAAVMRHGRYASGATGVGAADFVRFALERAWPCSE